MSALQSDPARLVMVIHDHQPVGNFDYVFESAVDRSYAPFVDLLAEHPRVRLGLHFTGCLLEWLESHRPELLSTVRQMVERGQVEILGGGWAEPMLSVLPDRDAIGQIRMMRAECARLFGTMPRGMWLAERVWDPGLPRLLRAAEVEYTLLDDTHFRYAGLLDDRLTGHYVTESAGDAMAVFPIDRQLRYAIPFREPEQAIEAIRSAGPGRTVTYGDDGEKFGIWPETHEWVWGKGWLRKFFGLLERAEEGIELLLPSEQLDRHRAAGRVYLPTASYHEMGEWTLRPEAGRQLIDLKHDLEDKGLAERAEPFLHGGIWSGFLAKYSEANTLHKRMLRASAKVAAATREADSLAGGVDDARRALYRGQCNCPYWHGLFGGLYLPHLRHAVYQQLVTAEAMVDDLDEVHLEVADLDGDMLDEVALEGPGLAAWVDPTDGGQLSVLDDRRRAVALGHVLSRRPETYHQDLLDAARKSASGEVDEDAPRSIHDVVKSKVEGIEKKLVYDEYERRILVDHLLPPGADADAITGRRDAELADLPHLRYAVETTSEDEGSAEVALRGRAELTGGGALAIDKTIRLVAPAALEVTYELTLEGDATLSATFAVESNLALVPGPEDAFGIMLIEPAEAAVTESPETAGSWPEVRVAAMRSALEGVTVTMKLEPEAALWRQPIETVSQSEDGAELVYQGTAVAAAWQVELRPGEAVTRTLTLSLG